MVESHDVKSDFQAILASNIRLGERILVIDHQTNGLIGPHLCKSLVGLGFSVKCLLLTSRNQSKEIRNDRRGGTDSIFSRHSSIVAGNLSEFNIEKLELPRVAQNISNAREECVSAQHQIAFPKLTFEQNQHVEKAISQACMQVARVYVLVDHLIETQLPLPASQKVAYSAEWLVDVVDNAMRHSKKTSKDRAESPGKNICADTKLSFIVVLSPDYSSSSCKCSSANIKLSRASLTFKPLVSNIFLIKYSCLIFGPFGELLALLNQFPDPNRESCEAQDKASEFECKNMLTFSLLAFASSALGATLFHGLHECAEWTATSSLKGGFQNVSLMIDKVNKNLQLSPLWSESIRRLIFVEDFCLLLIFETESWIQNCRATYTKFPEVFRPSFTSTQVEGSYDGDNSRYLKCCDFVEHVGELIQALVRRSNYEGSRNMKESTQNSSTIRTYILRKLRSILQWTEVPQQIYQEQMIDKECCLARCLLMRIVQPTNRFAVENNIPHNINQAQATIVHFTKQVSQKLWQKDCLIQRFHENARALPVNYPENMLMFDSHETLTKLCNTEEQTRALPSTTKSNKKGIRRHLNAVSVLSHFTAVLIKISHSVTSIVCCLVAIWVFELFMIYIGSKIRPIMSCWTGTCCAAVDAAWHRLGIGTSNWNKFWNCVVRLAVTGHLLSFLYVLLIAYLDQKDTVDRATSCEIYTTDNGDEAEPFLPPIHQYSNHTHKKCMKPNTPAIFENKCVDNETSCRKKVVTTIANPFQQNSHALTSSLISCLVHKDSTRRTSADDVPQKPGPQISRLPTFRRNKSCSVEK